MTSDGQNPGEDALAAALAVIGDRWTLLVVRAVNAGEVRFEQIQTSLGIARNILSRRLESLVGQGVLVRVPYTDKPVRNEYHLTDKGQLLCGAYDFLESWGRKWLDFG